MEKLSVLLRYYSCLNSTKDFLFCNFRKIKLLQCFTHSCTWYCFARQQNGRGMFLWRHWQSINLWNKGFGDSIEALNFLTEGACETGSLLLHYANMYFRTCVSHLNFELWQESLRNRCIEVLCFSAFYLSEHNNQVTLYFLQCVWCKHLNPSKATPIRGWLSVLGVHALWILGAR